MSKNSSNNSIQKTQNEYISWFVGRCYFDHANAEMLFTRLKLDTGGATQESTDTIIKHYINTFSRRYTMDEANSDILLTRIKWLTNVAPPQEKIDMVREFYISWFNGRYAMDQSNINILNIRSKTVFKKFEDEALEIVLTAEYETLQETLRASTKSTARLSSDDAQAKSALATAESGLKKLKSQNQKLTEQILESKAVLQNLEQKDLPDSIAHKEKLCLGMGDATEFILAKARADGNTTIEKLIVDSGFEETTKAPQEETDSTTPNPHNGAAAEDVDEPGLTGETPEQATDFP
jgi:hypothetical protein